MHFLSTPRLRLVTFLWLIAIHSFFVGLALILMPASAMPFFGFEVFAERFFPVQGGVFHIVMAVAYAMAATNSERSGRLIVLAIVAKLMAAVFLLSYYTFVDSVWMVLASGIGDGIMGVAVLLLFRSALRSAAGDDGNI